MVIVLGFFRLNGEILLVNNFFKKLKMRNVFFLVLWKFNEIVLLNEFV